MPFIDDGQRVELRVIRLPAFFRGRHLQRHHGLDRHLDAGTAILSLPVKSRDPFVRIARAERYIGMAFKPQVSALFGVPTVFDRRTASGIEPPAAKSRLPESSPSFADRAPPRIPTSSPPHQQGRKRRDVSREASRAP